LPSFNHGARDRAGLPFADFLQHPPGRAESAAVQKPFTMRALLAKVRETLAAAM
jgi:hypothetical protein